MMIPEAVVVLHAVHGQVTKAEYLWRVVLHLVGVTSIALFAYGCLGILTRCIVGAATHGDLEGRKI